tara:strand:+ start:425 stop:691 length:267 start_codon:yes stop_codon:yes gene_type:complete
MSKEMSYQADKKQWTLYGVVRMWLKYAGLFILIAQVLSFIYLDRFVTGLIILLWLTVPCGIKYVNINKWLWYPRQLFFLTIGLLMVLM